MEATVASLVTLHWYSYGETDSYKTRQTRQSLSGPTFSKSEVLPLELVIVVLV